MFTTWKGTREQIITFIKELNEKHENLKFEYEIPMQKIPSLEAMVCNNKENNLQTNLHRKPNGHTFMLNQNILAH